MSRLNQRSSSSSALLVALLTIAPCVASLADTISRPDFEDYTYEDNGFYQYTPDTGPGGDGRVVVGASGWRHWKWIETPEDSADFWALRTAAPLQVWYSWSLGNSTDRATIWAYNHEKAEWVAQQTVDGSGSAFAAFGSPFTYVDNQSGRYRCDVKWTAGAGNSGNAILKLDKVRLLVAEKLLDLEIASVELYEVLPDGSDAPADRLIKGEDYFYQALLRNCGARRWVGRVTVRFAPGCSLTWTAHDHAYATDMDPDDAINITSKLFTYTEDGDACATVSIIGLGADSLQDDNAGNDEVTSATVSPYSFPAPYNVAATLYEDDAYETVKVDWDVDWSQDDWDLWDAKAGTFWVDRRTCSGGGWNSVYESSEGSRVTWYVDPNVTESQCWEYRVRASSDLGISSSGASAPVDVAYNPSLSSVWPSVNTLVKVGDSLHITWSRADPNTGDGDTVRSTLYWHRENPPEGIEYDHDEDWAMTTTENDYFDWVVEEAAAGAQCRFRVEVEDDGGHTAGPVLSGGILTVAQLVEYKFYAEDDEDESLIGGVDLEAGGEDLTTSSSANNPETLTISEGDALDITYPANHTGSQYKYSRTWTRPHPLPQTAATDGDHSIYGIYERTHVRHTIVASPSSANCGVANPTWVASGSPGVAVTANAESGSLTFDHWKKGGVWNTDSRQVTLTYQGGPATWTAVYTDQTPPDAPTLTITPPDWTNNAGFTVNWTKPSGEISQIDRVYYKIGSAPTSFSDYDQAVVVSPAASSGSFSVTLSSDGQTPIYVWLRDASADHNVDHANHASVTAKLDRQAPAQPTVSINNGAPTTDSHTVTLSQLGANDNGLSGVTKLRIRNNSGNWSDEMDVPPGGTLSNWSLLSNGADLLVGQNTVYVKYRDKAGNWMTDANAGSDTIDYDPPPLAAPVLEATAGSEYRIDLRMVPVGLTEKSTVQWSTDAAALSNGVHEGEWIIASGDPWSHAHTGRNSSTVYFYRARTVNETLSQTSAWAYAHARTWDKPPTPATGLQVLPIDYQRIDVSWSWSNDPSTGPTLGTRLDWRPTGETAWQGIPKGAPGTGGAHSFSNLTPNSFYDFRVVTTNAYYESPTSVASARTYKLPELTATPQTTTFNVIQGPGHRPVISVDVSNTGEGLLTWTSIVTQGTAQIAPSTGGVQGGQSSNVSVTLDTDALPEGAAQFGVEFRADIAGTLSVRSVSFSGIIYNTAPQAKNLHIHPPSPVSRQGLSARYTFDDADGHSEGASEIKWYKDASLYSEGTATVPGSAVLKTHRWYFVVTPHDPYKAGAPVTSPEVTIGNAGPTMNGTSFTINQGGSHSINLHGLSADVDDPDSSLSYAIVSSPPAGLGAGVAGNTLSINPSTGYYGAATVRVQVSDGDKSAAANIESYVDARPWLTGSPPSAYSVNEDQELRVDLWPYFHDVETPDHQLVFSASDSTPEMVPSISQGRYLVVNGAANWPSTDAGDQINPVTVTARDSRNQSVNWTPSITFQPVNDAPQWTGYVQNLTMTDGDTDPLAQMSAGGNALRSILGDVDTDLAAVSDAQLLSVSSPDAGLSATLETDTLRISPAGGWWRSVTITVTANDRETRIAPNNATADTTFRVTVTDDDTTPPAFSGVQVVHTNPAAQPPSVEGSTIWVEEHEAFHVRCTLADTQNAVYDDATGGGPGEHGIYLVWDDDGDLNDGHAGLIQMSSVSGDVYQTDSPIPGLDGAVDRQFVYEVVAWDDDFDRNFAGDRAQGRTGPRRDIVINDLPQVFPVQPPDGTEYHFDVPLAFSLSDLNSDAIDLSVRFYDPESDSWKDADVLDAVSSLVVYSQRTNAWRSAYEVAPGQWEGNLPGYDLGAPNAPNVDKLYTNLCQVTFFISDGHHTGTPASIAFHLDNNLPPTVVLEPVEDVYDAWGEQGHPSASTPLYRFVIRDVENDTVSLEIDHRWGLAEEWTSSAIANALGARPDNHLPDLHPDVDHGTGWFLWDAVSNVVADGQVPFSPQVLSDAQLRLIPSDLDTNIAAAAISEGFGVNLFPLPAVEYVTNDCVSIESNRTVRLKYTLEPGYLRYVAGSNVAYRIVERSLNAIPPGDPVGPNLGLEYAYMLSGETNQQSISTASTELIGLSLDSKDFSQYSAPDPFSVRWDYFKSPSLPMEDGLAGVRFAVRPSHHKTAGWFPIGPFALDNNLPPVVSNVILSASGNLQTTNGAYRGNIHFTFDSWDREGDPASFTFHWATNAAAPGQAATVQWDPALAGAGNGSHAVVWESRRDIPSGAFSQVWFRVTGCDTECGDPSSSAPFAIHNLGLPPVVQILSVSNGAPAASRALTVTYAVSDVDDDACRMFEWAYSPDGGTNWTAIPWQTIWPGFSDALGTNSVAWDPFAGAPTFAGSTHSNILLRVAADDGTPFVYESVDLTGPRHALAWDGADLWIFDFAGDTGYQHDLSASGWPADRTSPLPTWGGLVGYPTTGKASALGANEVALCLPGETLDYAELRWGATGIDLWTADDMPDTARALASTSPSEFWLSEPAQGFINRYNYSGGFTLVESVSAAGTNETSLTSRDGSFDDAGLWSLDEVGVLRQYAQDTNTLAWKHARTMETGLSGLTAIEDRQGEFWAIDGTSQRLIRSPYLSASLLAESAPFEIDGDFSNAPPVITTAAISNTTVDTLADIELTLAGVDPEGSNLTWTVLWSRNGHYEAAYDGSTTIPHGDTAQGDTWEAFIRAHDGTRASSWMSPSPVNVTNTPMSIGTLAQQPAAAFTEDDLAVVGVPDDPDSSTIGLTYAWTQNGLPATFDGSSVPFWATDVGQSWTCTVSAVDSAAATSKFTFAWVIQNHPPVIDPIPDVTAQEGEWVWFRVTASDPEEHELSYDVQWNPAQFEGPSDVQWTYDTNSHTFLWWPDYSRGGRTYDFAFTVADDHSGISTQAMQVTINEAQRPPWLYAGADIVVQEGETINLLSGQRGGDFDLTNGTVTLDVLAGLGVDFSLSGWKAGTWDSNFTYQATFDDSGQHMVELTAIDSTGATSQPRTVNIFVENVNRAPVLSAPGPQSVIEGQVLFFDLTASDPDNQNSVTNDDNVLSFYWDGPVGSTVTNTGSNIWTFSWTPGYDDAGDYNAYFEVADEGDPALAATQLVQIAVQNDSTADSDGDSLLDDWERRYFGNLDKDGSDDSDNDGFTDKEEHDAGTDPLWVLEIPAWITRTYSLTQGWNTVVIDVTATNMAVDVLLADIIDRVEQVRVWDEESQSWVRWDVVTQQLGTHTSAFTIATRQAIVIKATAKAVWEVDGATSDHSVDLTIGWNYAGIPSYVAQETVSFSQPLEGACEIISDGVDRYDMLAPDTHGGLTNLTPARAYWLKMNQTEEWQP